MSRHVSGTFACRQRGAGLLQVDRGEYARATGEVGTTSQGLILYPKVQACLHPSESQSDRRHIVSTLHDDIFS